MLSRLGPSLALVMTPYAAVCATGALLSDPDRRMAWIAGALAALAVVGLISSAIWFAG